LNTIYFFIFKGDSDFLVYKFLPSIESETVSNPFLPVHPEILAKIANPVPIITGINSMEGLVGIEGKVFSLKLPAVLRKH